MLRDYQVKALDLIRALYKKNHKKVLLHLATGGGKTVIFCEIMKSVAAKGNKAIMVVRGKNLVEQAAERLQREGVSHGVYQGTHWNKNRQANIQICSIDTLNRRKIAPPADLVVIDEAHYAQSDSFVWLAQQYPNAFFLPVTATPYPVKSLAHVAEKVVFPISIKDLIKQGYLVGARYFAPSAPNLDDVAIDSKTKDYKTRDLAAVCDTAKLTGDVIRHYKKLCDGLPAICFAVNKSHSKSLVERFIDAGISAVHIEDKTSDTERKEVMAKHESGEIKVICNVGILCTGVDMPYLRAVIMARPTKSKILYIQQAGRGTRPYKDKPNFLLIDHAHNVHHHGFITVDHEAELDGKPKNKKEIDVKITTCEECYAIYEGSECPECGWKKPPPKRKLEADDGELKEIDPNDPAYARKTVQLHSGIAGLDSQIERWIDTAEKRLYAAGWIFNKMKMAYGEKVAKKYYYIARNYMSDALKKRQPRTPRQANTTGVQSIGFGPRLEE